MSSKLEVIFDKYITETGEKRIKDILDSLEIDNNEMAARMAVSILKIKLAPSQAGLDELQLMMVVGQAIGYSYAIKKLGEEQFDCGGKPNE